MPLLFTIAGFAIWHSLQKRTVAAFVRERLHRLFIPFIVGLLVIVPPQIYFRLCGDPEYQESYAQFYPRFFDITFTMDFPWFFSATPATHLFHPAHLWFLYILLVLTLLLLPVFLYHSSEDVASLRCVQYRRDVDETPMSGIGRLLPIAALQ